VPFVCPRLYLSTKVLQTSGNHLMAGENAEQAINVRTGKLQVQASGGSGARYTDTMMIALSS